MIINPNKKYKFVDKDLVNGFVVLTGKELNAILEKAYKEHLESKNEKSYFCPTCNKTYSFKKWIHCWWHNYTFRHLLRDFGSNNPVPYWNCGQKLINAGLLDYLHDSSIERGTKEYIQSTIYELEGIIEYMNPNVKIYRDNGLCSDDERNNIRFKDCKDDIYKEYKKHIYEHGGRF